MRAIDETAVDDPVEQSKQAIEDISPSVSSRVLEFEWINPNTRTLEKFQFTQEALGFFPVQEFNALLADTAKSFTDGTNGLKLGDLFSPKVRQQIEVPQGVALTEEGVNKVVDEIGVELIQGFFYLIKILPEFQLDVICMSLGVPPGQRAWVKEQLKQPISKNGLKIDEGFDILSVFIQQNVREIKRFLFEKATDLFSLAQREVLGDDQQSEEEPIEATALEIPTGTPVTEEPMPAPTSPGGTPSSTSSPDIPVNVL
jgi:hypothetical protein